MYYLIVTYYFEKRQVSTLKLDRNFAMSINDLKINTNILYIRKSSLIYLYNNL